MLSDLEIQIEQTCANITIDKLATLEVDKSQMKQLFQNLISNALKFHRPDVPPEIKITGQAQPAEDNEAGAQYKITVSDNGIGFDMQYHERIFTVFQRLHGRSEYEGTGVGLAICRRIIERHGGTIMAESIPGEGTSFIITLPLVHGRKSNEQS